MYDILNNTEFPNSQLNWFYLRTSLYNIFYKFNKI